MSVCLYICLPTCLSACLYICLSICMSACMSICLSISLDELIDRIRCSLPTPPDRLLLAISSLGGHRQPLTHYQAPSIDRQSLCTPHSPYPNLPAFPRVSRSLPGSISGPWDACLSVSKPSILLAMRSGDIHCSAN